jgi:hypothetical protein
VGCAPPDAFRLALDTLDGWMGRRDVFSSPRAGIFSLSLDIRLLLRWGLLKLIVAILAGCDESHGMLRFWRGWTNFFPVALETLDGSIGLRIERAVGRFLL